MIPSMDIKQKNINMPVLISIFVLNIAISNSNVSIFDIAAHTIKQILMGINAKALLKKIMLPIKKTTPTRLYNQSAIPVDFLRTIFQNESKNPGVKRYKTTNFILYPCLLLLKHKLLRHSRRKSPEELHLLSKSLRAAKAIQLL